MIGTLVNAASIVAGSIAGTLFKIGIPERVKTTVMHAISLSVLIIGFDSALKYKNLLLVIISLAIGGILGELLDIEKKLNQFGDFLERKLSGNGGNKISEGFVTASLIYCVGAMAIVGALKDGLQGDHSILFAKSMLDGISSIIFASTLGIGVMMSAISVLVYQGAITICASLLKSLLTTHVVADMSAIGGILIIGISLNMLNLTKIKIGNLLPSIFIPIVYETILKIF
ncbi:DUF554 domain-containing protein [Thermoanaerobacterium thermosaccharolyticum]|uniref:DUF554 domain-containing protein n=1 Tax=Thermoanaerobacterium thermosaccharolyticum TaxID=1517 RepID=UPI00178219B8|nr:DUF554 domain-containing protein [Thermoanaerobacterium thermosaccharolyticum]MBE0067813.1 DUF554 domain-containing protein [Thermoanaerobacterium thermosaccharolyticum]MBE0227376.1 DUF554 domain-containing protein [Thermoanaerobacterium thermosaccharolyticum]